MEKRSPKHVLSRFLLSSFLMTLMLFSANVHAAPIGTIFWSDVKTNYQFWIQFDDQGKDIVQAKAYAQDNWKIVLSNTLLNLDIPTSEAKRVDTTGIIPERVKVHKGGPDTPLKIVSQDQYAVFIHGEFSFFPKPPGHIIDYSIKIKNDVSLPSSRYSFASFKTDHGSGTWIYWQDNKTAAFLSPTFQDVKDFDILNDKVIFPGTGLNLKDAKFGVEVARDEYYKSQKAETSEPETLSRLNKAAKAFWTSEVSVKGNTDVPIPAKDIVKGFATELNGPVSKMKYLEPDPGTRDRIDQIFRSLVKKEIGSAKILGPAGTGKTTLVKQLVAELLQGKGPDELQDTVYLLVDPAALSTGSKYLGSYETKINAMLALSRAHKIVWVIDETHTLRGKGSHSGDSNDIFQLMKPALTEGYFRMIGMSTEAEWSAAFAGDPALDQRFGKIQITEPTGNSLRLILTNWMKKHSFPEVDQKVLDLIIKLSSEFNAEGAQPRKATLLIEDIFSDQKLKGPGHPPTVEEVKAAGQRIYNLHPDHFDRSKMRIRLANMPKALNQSVIGQEPAKQSLIDAVTLTMTGMEDKKKPKGRKIFAGPRGQGKTEIVMAFGKAMELPVARIVMTKYTHPGQTDELKREIVQAMRRNASSVLFFDEIEKAHSSIQKDLLDVLDSGTFTVSEHTNGGANSIFVPINVRNAYVFMATNAGASYIDGLSEKSKYNSEQMNESMRRDGLNDLVLDRMDGVIPFFYLNRNEYRSVIITQIKSILAGFKENNPDVKLTLENLRGFIDQTVKDTFREKMSNREALVALSASLRLKIGKAALASFEEDRVKLKLDGQRTRKSSIANSCSKVFN